MSDTGLKVNKSHVLLSSTTTLCCEQTLGCPCYTWKQQRIFSWGNCLSARMVEGEADEH